MSPIVVVPKPKRPGEVRICVDMREPNRAIKRERHPSPTMDDIVHRLNNARVFSKVDLKSGYHQLVLAEESRYITTFSTHDGLWRYKRLNFGISSASEVFQNVIANVIDGIDGALNMSDDIFIFGKGQKFPRIDAMVAKLLDECVACTASYDPKAREPLVMTELPSRKWSHLCADCYGPLPSG